MRARPILIASTSLCLVACAASQGPVADSPKVIPWVATPEAYHPNEITSPVRFLSAGQAANAIKATVAQVEPLLLPTAIPTGSDAYLAADRSRFHVTYVSKAAGQRVFFSVGTTDPPPLGPHSAVSTRSFRKTLARYSVDDQSLAGSYRSLTWTEPGTWTTPVPATGIPYFLSATGLSDAQFWQLAGSMDAIPWPPAPAPCASTDLAAVYGGGVGATGHIISSVLVANAGRTACSLQGTPGLSLMSPNGSAVVTRQVDSNPMDPAPAAPVVLQPGSALPQPHTQIPGEAMFFFEWYDCPERTVSVSSLVLALPGGGGRLAVSAGQPGPGGLSSSRCDDASQGHVLYVGPFQPTVSTVPSPAPPAQLVVAIHAPATVLAGQRLLYQVTLTNVSGAPFHFDACPPYREAMDTVPAKRVLGMYELNCVPVGTVGSSGSVTFAMQLEIPADAPTGPQELSWRYGDFLTDGSAATTITITGR
jgi:uncharacterized protein DUF4232